MPGAALAAPAALPAAPPREADDAAPAGDGGPATSGGIGGRAARAPGDDMRQEAEPGPSPGVGLPATPAFPDPVEDAAATDQDASAAPLAAPAGAQPAAPDPATPALPSGSGPGALPGLPQGPSGEGAAGD
jgi:hypothetical protein